MRRTLTWLAGLAGIAALLRRRSRAASHAPGVVEPPADPAEELRRKLDEARETSGEMTAEASTDTPAASLDERRARVHEQAQDAIALMREADATPDSPPAQGA